MLHSYFWQRIDVTSKVPALRAGYFATVMNACKSLGGLYAVAYVVRGRKNVQRAPQIQLPVWAGTRHKDYEIHGRP